MRALSLHTFVLLALAFTVACSSGAGTPAASSSPLTPSDTRTIGASAINVHVDFARCLSGGGDGDCFGVAVLPARVTAAAVAPGAPSNLTVSAAGSTVFLAWTPPASGDPATSYNIEAGSASGLANLANFNTGNSLTTFSAAGVGSGTYYVRIRAVNAAGVSGASNEAVLVVGGATGACAGPPTGLTLLYQTAGSIAMAWNAPSTGSPFSYVIEAGSAPGLADLANFDTGNPSTTFSASGVGAGAYYVRVRSHSSCGNSSPSNEILIFVVGFTGDVQVSVSWDAPTDVDLHVVDPGGEEIYYGNPVSASGGQLDVDSNAACSIDGRQIENIRWGSRAPGGTYLVRVDYWDSCGISATNYTVTVKNGAATQVIRGTLTGPGDHGGFGSGNFITSFLHSAAITTSRFTIRPPQLFEPSATKIAASAKR